MVKAGKRVICSNQVMACPYVLLTFFFEIFFTRTRCAAPFFTIEFVDFIKTLKAYELFFLKLNCEIKDRFIVKIEIMRIYYIDKT